MQTKTLQSKRALRTALLVLLLGVAGMGKNYAQTSFTAGDLNYTINDDGTTVTLTGHVDGTSATGSLIIPESVSFEGSQYAVTRIRYFSFSNSYGLTGDLTIPNSVREIGSFAFSFCTGLNGRLTLGNSLTYIDSDAFSGCNFSGELILPESLTHIGPDAFDCRNISGVLHIPSSLKNISEGAFELCKFDAIEVDAENPWYKSQDGVLFTSGMDTLVLYPIGSQATTYYVPNSVKRIGSSAFYACENLLSVSFPNSLEVIGSYAFNGCWGITSFSIPESVVSVCRSSFQQTSWWFNQNTDIVYLDGWCFGPKGYGGLSGALVIEDGTRGIASHAFNSTEITSLTLPNSLNYIDGYAFYNCSGLCGDLNIPNSVTTIENHAFSECSGFSGDLNIPNSVTSIGEFAFDKCSGFDGHLTLSNSVTTIEDYAFSRCSGFSGDLNIPNSVTSIGHRAFYECSGFNGRLSLGNALAKIGEGAFMYCSGLNGELVIPNSVTTIEDYTFGLCSGFSGDLNIPNSVTSIGQYAFYECSGFNGRLSLGNALAKIGRRAFMYCSGLNGELVIPNSVTTMGSFAFAGCTGFTGNLVIPNSLTEIYEGSFSNYGGGPMGFDGNLIIPGSICQIYDQAFCNCNNLQSITIYCETPPEVIKIWLDEEEDAFYGINKEIPVNVPCGSVSEYASAGYWNQFNNFQEFLPYSMTIEAYEPEKCSVSILQQPSCGLQAIVKAEPAVGFVFEAWEENGMVVSNDITYAFTVDRDMHLYAKVKPGTGVSEILGEMVSVYPNPTNGQVIIEAEGLKQITVSNVLGQVIYEGKAEGDVFEYNFSNNESGVYLIRIESANGIAVKKVTVTR